MSQKAAHLGSPHTQTNFPVCLSEAEHKQQIEVGWGHELLFFLQMRSIICHLNHGLGIGAVVCELSCILRGFDRNWLMQDARCCDCPKDLPALKFPGDPNDEVTELHFEQQSPLPQCSPW